MRSAVMGILLLQHYHTWITNLDVKLYTERGGFGRHEGETGSSLNSHFQDWLGYK